MYCKAWNLISADYITMYKLWQNSKQKLSESILKAYLHGTTLSHATSLQQAYDTNCIV